MPRMDSREPSDDDLENLFLQEIHPIISGVVRKVCASLRRHPDLIDADEFARRIAYLLWKNDYQVLRSFKHESEPETWLFTIAKRHILHELRERDGIVSLDDVPPDSLIAQPNQEERLTSQYKEKALLAAISKLTEREQKLFGLLRQGRSTEKIAEELGIKRRSASVMKRALIKKLRRIIEEGCAI